MLLFDYQPQKEDAPMISKTFSVNTEVLPEVLGFVEETLESYACAMKVQMAICIAIEEVFVNVANYAYETKEGTVTLELAFDEDARIVTFRVSDEGVPFDPLQKEDPDVTLSMEERQIGGLGIFIVKKTMDTLRYDHQDGKNILTMTRKI
jgi:anti-sigma regulatory factor (Ser/Thr protein kinase)